MEELAKAGILLVIKSKRSPPKKPPKQQTNKKTKTKPSTPQALCIYKHILSIGSSGDDRPGGDVHSHGHNNPADLLCILLVIIKSKGISSPPTPPPQQTHKQQQQQQQKPKKACQEQCIWVWAAEITNLVNFDVHSHVH